MIPSDADTEQTELIASYDRASGYTYWRKPGVAGARFLGATGS